MCSGGNDWNSWPAHYHVLLDEIDFSPDDLQNLIHSFSYVYQRSTMAISIVAPICYAHLAAAQMGQFMKFEDLSDTSSGKGRVSHHQRASQFKCSLGFMTRSRAPCSSADVPAANC